MEDIIEEKKTGWSAEDQHYENRHIMLPEIVEIDESKSYVSSNRDGGNNVYVAVGKDDLDVLKWALKQAVLPGASVFLIHVFSPFNYIPTPVGKLPKSQASPEQVRTFLREENARRQNLLQKYVHLCNEAKVTVDTMLIESNQAAQAILELLPVLNISMLVMGTKRLSPRRLRLGLGKAEFVKKNAPDFCEVTIIYDGKKVMEGPEVVWEESQEQSGRKAQHPEKSFLDCVCFTGNSG